MANMATSCLLDRSESNKPRVLTSEGQWMAYVILDLVLINNIITFLLSVSALQQIISSIENNSTV